MTELASSGAVKTGQVTWLAEARDRLSRVPLNGVLVAGAVWLAIMLLARPELGQWRTGQEAFCYWFASLYAPYAHSDWTQPIAYVYSPAFLQAIAPLTELPWPLFFAVWTAVLLGAVRFLTGPRLFAIGALLAALELAGGNISLLLGVAIVIGFRWPAAWGLVLLTKVTPGIGLLWFAVRREWRSLGIAFGATLVVMAVSYSMMPWAWAEWVSVLTNIAGRNGTWAAVPIPLLLRLPVAVAVVVWGARTDRRWTVPVASMLALPALWYGGLTMLLAVVALQREPWKSAQPAVPDEPSPEPLSASAA